jgi:hypothetical protein
MTPNCGIGTGTTPNSGRVCACAAPIEPAAMPAHAAATADHESSFRIISFPPVFFLLPTSNFRRRMSFLYRRSRFTEVLNRKSSVFALIYISDLLLRLKFAFFYNVFYII